MWPHPNIFKMAYADGNYFKMLVTKKKHFLKVEPLRFSWFFNFHFFVSVLVVVAFLFFFLGSTCCFCLICRGVGVCWGVLCFCCDGFFVLLVCLFYFVCLSVCLFVCFCLYCFLFVFCFCLFFVKVEKYIYIWVS